MTKAGGRRRGKPRARARHARRGLVIALLSVALVVIVSFDELHAALVRIYDGAERVMAAHPVLGASVFVFLAALSAMFAFASSAVLVPAALAVWGQLLCIVLLWLGWTLGGTAAYAIARFFGRPIVTRLTSKSAMARYEETISCETPFSVVLVFQLALPSEIPGYVLGLARYPFLVYLAALALAEIPFAVGTAYLGVGLIERKTFLLVGLGAAGVLSTVLGLRILKRRLAGTEGLASS